MTTATTAMITAAVIMTIATTMTPPPLGPGKPPLQRAMVMFIPMVTPTP